MEEKTEILGIDSLSSGEEDADRTLFLQCYDSNFFNKKVERETFHLQSGYVLKQRYVVGEVIGFGGFGTIYKCYDNVLRENVAIKEYYPTIFLSREEGKSHVNIYDKKKTEAFEKGKSEFLEEARNLAKFNRHSNIVHVFDFFEANGTAYFVMEYLEGCSLSSYIQEKRKINQLVDISEALDIAKSVLSGLVELHKEHILHRDIKPANIFLCKNGDIKIIDLGAARFANEEIEKTRTIIITPGYAPVEQYQIKSKQGAYTDTYAVGAVLYEMITGRKPDESINRKIEDTVVEPRKLNQNITKNLNNIILRAIAVSPEIRFQTAKKFLEAIENQGSVRNEKNEIRRKKVIRMVLICLLSCLIMLGAGFTWKLYENNRKMASLEPTNLTLWIVADDSGNCNRKQMFEDMAKEFLNNNPMVTLNIEEFSKDEYVDRIVNSFETGSGPSIFESDLIELNLTQYASSIKQLYDMRTFDKDEYYISDQLTSADAVFQIPLSFDVPILYVNQMLENSTGSAYETTKEEFLQEEQKEFLGSVSDYKEIQTVLPGAYDVSFPNAQEQKFIYHNYMSVNKAVSDMEMQAAIRFIYYCLSDTAQDIFTVQNDNYLPVKNTVLDVFVDINADFEGLKQYLEQIVSNLE